MTLHEAASVFLIIGGVLLGPIEGRQIENAEKAAKWAACMKEKNPGPFPQVMDTAVRECGINTIMEETTAETCERAMREVGAYRLPGQPSAWHGPDGVRAYCIPTPSGLIQ